MALPPGTYLRLRREAAGVSREAVAIALAAGQSHRQEAALLRVEQLESNLAFVTPAEVALMRAAFRFDGQVLDQLADIHFFRADLPHPRLCRVCGCSELDACLDFHQSTACHWVDLDLCSACVTRSRSLAA